MSIVIGLIFKRQGHLDGGQRLLGGTIEMVQSRFLSYNLHHSLFYRKISDSSPQTTPTFPTPRPSHVRFPLLPPFLHDLSLRRLLEAGVLLIINKMNHKGSHPLIRNTYNFQTTHQKQTREATRLQDHRTNTTSPLGGHGGHPPIHTPHHKFAQSIQQLQSKIEGVENMVKAKGGIGEALTIEKEELWKGRGIKNGEKRQEWVSKGKVLLCGSMSGQDLKLHPQPSKGQDYSPIRKSYRLPQPKKHSEQSPIKIPPINLHAITHGTHTSSFTLTPAGSIASTTTSGSPPRKLQKKCDQSRSFMELQTAVEMDSSFTMKLNGSFMNLLNEEEKDRVNISMGNGNGNSPQNGHCNEISLFGSTPIPVPIEKTMKTSKTLSYLNIKQTLNQLKTRSNSRKGKTTPNAIIQGFQLGRVLGKGKFGEVYLGRHVATGFIVAMKKVQKKKLQEFRMVSQFIQEIRLHSSLDHPTIVKFYALLQEKDCFYLVLQYLNGGTLFDYQNEVGALGVKQAVDFLKDIIDALIYLHEKSIAHRDIKPQNIVICNGIAKVCDFGWSAVIQNVRSTFCGTLDYAPPQIIERKTYDTTVDLWCIGVLTYEMLVGRAPFESQSRSEVMESIVNVDKFGIPLMQQLPPQAREFIEALLQKDPAKRPKITHLYEFQLFVNNLGPSKRKERSGVK